MPSSFVPSVATSRPSNVEFVVIAPVIAPPASGSLAAILVLTVEEKLASSPSAAANSLSVFKAAGDESTRLETAVSV